VPEKPQLEGIEKRWSLHWDEQRTYAFDRTAKRDAVYSIDTPPPTVSGSLHAGHVFSYTHADIIARFQRMTGKTVSERTPDDRSAANCRRHPRFNQTVAALCPRGRIASKFAITIYQSNLTKSLKIS